MHLGNENVPIDNDNVRIENLENKNLGNEMLLGHNLNCMIDHVENDNVQEHYISPNYNQHEGPRTPK